VTPWGVGYVRMDAGVSGLTVGDVSNIFIDESGTIRAWSPRVCWLRTDGAESVFLVGYELQGTSSSEWVLRTITFDTNLAVMMGPPSSGTTTGAHPSLTRLSDDEVLYAYEPYSEFANSARRIITVSGSSISIGSAATWANIWQQMASAKPARSHFAGTKVAYVYTFDSFLNIYWRLKTDADSFVGDADWWNVHEVAGPAKPHYDPQIIDLGTAGDGGEDSLITWLGVGSDNVFEFGACGVRLYSNNSQWRGTASLFNLSLGGSSHGRFWSARTGDYQVTLFVSDQTVTGNPQSMYSVTATLDPDDMSISWGTLRTIPLTDTWGANPRVAIRPDGYGVLAKLTDDDNGFYYGRSFDFNLISPGASEPTYSTPAVSPVGNPTFDNIFETDIAIDPNTGIGLYLANEEEEFGPDEGDFFATYCIGVPFKVAT
jgi:hypothetical protein